MDESAAEMREKVNRGEFARVKTDADLAAELRAEMSPILGEVCKVLDKARAAGMKIDFMIQPDQFGRHVLPHVQITKAL